MVVQKAPLTILGAKLISGETVTGCYPIHFDSVEQMDQFIHSIQVNPTDPIELPTGERIGLDPHTEWFIFQILRANFFLLLFSVIR